MSGGKLLPYGRPVSGSIELGPVEPRQPPSRFVQTTWQRSVSNARPGPIIESHQPTPRTSVSPALGTSGVTPAACASPESAWQTRSDVVPCLAQRAVGLVRDPHAAKLAAAVEPERLVQVDVLGLDDHPASLRVRADPS